MRRGATLSPCGRYRYTLERSWSERGPITWIMLNPSTADARVEDPTIRRVMGFSQRWGHGSLRVLNLSPLRTPQPSECLAHALPAQVRERNLALLTEAGATCGPVVAAWGVQGAKLLHRDPDLVEVISGLSLQALGTTRDGHPLHPLARGSHRVPDETRLTPWP